MPKLQINFYQVHFILIFVTMETARSFTFPSIDLASTTPPVIFGQTPEFWRKDSVDIRTNLGNMKPGSEKGIGNILRECPSELPIFDNTCKMGKYTCAGRCGDILTNKRGSPTSRVSCSCDLLCNIYNDCCFDFGDHCPAVQAEFQEKMGHLDDVTSTCTNDGFKVVDSCPPVPPETVTEDITNLGSQLGARTGLGSVRGSSNGSSDTGTAGIPDNSVMVNVNTSDTSETTSTNATDDSTSSTSKPGGTGSKSSFSDSLVVTDPTTGISYVNQTVMQCNRNVSRLLAQDAGSVEMDSVVPIFWNRRMFVDDILGQPHQAVHIEDNTVMSWVDYPPADVQPRYCAKRFQISCFREISERSCWFMEPTSMIDFCKDVRSAHSTILETGGQIDEELLKNYTNDAKPAQDDSLMPWDALPDIGNSNQSEVSIVDFVNITANQSCVVRNYKDDFRSFRGGLVSFSMTMALNHETGVFVVSNENPVRWEKIQCKMAGNDFRAEPVCDQVFCTNGFFYAPGFAATSACLKPVLLEISFLFRGIDSDTLARILDMVQAASIHYGGNMEVQALGGFVDMDGGNMAYTDMYGVQNISLNDSSDRIPSTLALEDSLKDLDVNERFKFPESIQLCFVFRELSTDTAEDVTGVEYDDQGTVLFTEEEKVTSRCDRVYLHESKVYSLSLHRPKTRQVVQIVSGGGMEENGAAGVHGRDSTGRLVAMATVVLFGVLKAWNTAR